MSELVGVEAGGDREKCFATEEIAVKPRASLSLAGSVPLLLFLPWDRI